MKQTKSTLPPSVSKFSLGSGKSMGPSKYSMGGKDDIDIENVDIENELTEDIRQVRETNKRFEATNDHETYLVVCFSCKEDKVVFCEELGITEHTYVDGYELARRVDVEPKKPRFKLHDPFIVPKSRKTK